MLVILIAIAIGLGLFIYTGTGARKKKNSWSLDREPFDWFFGGFFTIFISVIIGAAISLGIGIFLIPRETNTYKADLVTIGSQTGSSGHFFLGTGSLRGEYYYSYWYKYEDGISHVLLSEDSAGTVIVYQDQTPETAYMNWNITKCVSGWWDPLLVYCPKDWSHYRFHVPPGTVDNNFSLE